MTVTYPTEINVLKSKFKGSLEGIFSKTLGENVVGNICPTCKAYQGVFLLAINF